MLRIRKWLHAKASDRVYREHHRWLADPKNGFQMTFRDRILERVDFHGAHISSSDFSDGNFHDSNFDHANLQRASFKEADMTGSKFPEAIMHFVDISTAELRKAKHQIHIRNRQKEDLESLLLQARRLWNDVDLLRKINAADAAGTISLQQIAGNLSSFLSDWKVVRSYKELS